jgi:hypothetical protein
MVGRVTARAHRRGYQTLLVETFSVDRLGVILEDAVLGDVVDELDLGAFLMAAYAESRHVGHVRLRFWIVCPADIVGSVAVLAARGQLVPSRHGATVKALVELLLFDKVTLAAVDRLEIFGMREGLVVDVRVAKRTADVVVRRNPQGGGAKGWRGPGLHPTPDPAGVVTHLAGFGAGQRAPALLSPD